MLYNLFENRAFVSVFAVALLAEGVDRNRGFRAFRPLAQGVALLAEGVDRNMDSQKDVWGDFVSPSSRRAWIEIPAPLLAHR